jgi:mannosyl-oligosaccharide alpha-1,2-mannosidase
MNMCSSNIYRPRNLNFVSRGCVSWRETNPSSLLKNGSFADLRATRGILDTLLYLSPTRQLLYVTDTTGDHPSRRFEHLSCFYPGLLALGAHTLSSDTSHPEISEHDLALQRWAAEGLAHTCWIMYGESVSGLGPEEALFASAGLPVTKTFTERWMSHVRNWEAEGSPEDKPPGVANLAKLVMKGSGVARDYATRRGQYLLRPEV